MKKKVLFVAITVIGIIVLAACASIQLPFAKSSTSSNASANANPQNAAANFANQPVENKLAIGLLELEGTDKAVTGDQAKQLLPLWKAVKGLRANTNTTTDEMNALYTQIEQVLTPAQVQAIKDMTLDQTKMQDLMKKYNVQFPQRQFNGTPNPSFRETLQANGGQFRNGGQGFGGGGFQGGGQGGNFIPNGGNGQGFTRRTPVPGQTPNPNRGAGFRGGLNFIFVDPLITVLTQRASA